MFGNGEESESGQADYRRSVPGSSSGREKADEDGCCAIDGGDGATGEPSVWE
ncbi:hypothetical protein GCM10020255_020160 [Rhodococcus baikonurensis]